MEIDFEAGPCGHLDISPTGPAFFCTFWNTADSGRLYTVKAAA